MSKPLVWNLCIVCWTLGLAALSTAGCGVSTQEHARTLRQLSDTRLSLSVARNKLRQSRERARACSRLDLRSAFAKKQDAYVRCSDERYRLRRTCKKTIGGLRQQVVRLQKEARWSRRYVQLMSRSFAGPASKQLSASLKKARLLLERCKAPGKHRNQQVALQVNPRGKVTRLRFRGRKTPAPIRRCLTRAARKLQLHASPQRFPYTLRLRLGLAMRPPYMTPALRRTRGCRRDADCTVLCIRRDQCCRGCSCGNVVNRRYARWLTRYCKRKLRGQRCQLPPCRRRRYSPPPRVACVKNLCVLRYPRRQRKRKRKVSTP